MDRRQFLKLGLLTGCGLAAAAGVGYFITRDEDPLADLQEWFTNVADQNVQNANYARIRGNLKREFFDKGFVY